MKKNVISSLLCGILLMSPVQGMAQETTATEATTTDPLAHSLGSMVNPTVYFNLMSQMMTNPYGIMLNPFSTCGQCHNAEDMDRYNTMLGPMLMMINPANWMNPQAYTKMMTAPMNPAEYTKWYEGWMEKYGAMFGQPAQTEQQQ